MKNDYEIRGDTTAIFIRRNGQVLEALIDSTDLPLAQSHPNTWFATLNTGSGHFYVLGHIQRRRKRSHVFLHRLIVNAPDGMDVDHINRNPLDNRRVNLRIVTRQRNVLNTKPLISTNTSGCRGVTWNKRNQAWQANIMKDGKNYYLGQFRTKEAAKQAYNQRFHQFFPGVPVPDGHDAVAVGGQP